MTQRVQSILVTGASGRLGRAVLHRLGEAGVAGVRADSATDSLGRIGPDGRAPAAAFVGVETVINCAGRTEGSEADLEQANVAFASALAQSARAARVKRFVHVSSFSVFGRVPRIGPTSALKPDSAYGHSKLRAERRLSDLAARDFDVTILRLPFMFSAEHPGLLQPLLRLVQRVGAVPTHVGRQPIERSMITFDDAAVLLAGLAGERHAAVLTAADPKPLSMEGLAGLVGRALGKTIAPIRIARPIAATIGLLSPRIKHSLFSSSVLDPGLNFYSPQRGNPVEGEIMRYLDFRRSGAMS